MAEKALKVAAADTRANDNVDNVDRSIYPIPFAPYISFTIRDSLHLYQYCGEVDIVDRLIMLIGIYIYHHSQFAPSLQKYCG